MAVWAHTLVKENESVCSCFDVYLSFFVNMQQLHPKIVQNFLQQVLSVCDQTAHKLFLKIWKQIFPIAIFKSDNASLLLGNHLLSGVQEKGEVPMRETRSTFCRALSETWRDS